MRQKKSFEAEPKRGDKNEIRQKIAVEQDV